MLGHRLCAAWRDRYDIFGTVRTPAAAAAVTANALAPDRCLGGVAVSSPPEAVDTLLERTRPAVVVNAIGLIKQRAEAADTARTIAVNAHFPHVLASACERARARLVHISTDCVFSGVRGLYREADLADADDVYGRSKRLGEPGEPAVTLRMSLIGPELGSAHGLVEWFLATAQPGAAVPGYRRAVFSGLTTAVAADAIGHLIDHHPSLVGTWHVAAAPITKLDLLVRLAGLLGISADVVPTDTPVIDRSLDGSAFAVATGWAAPDWGAMLAQLADEMRASSTVRTRVI